MKHCSDCLKPIADTNKSGRCRSCSALFSFANGRKQPKPKVGIVLKPRTTTYVERPGRP